MRISRRRVLMIAAAAAASISIDLPRVASAQDFTYNLPPINGFQPLVVFGMTDEQVDGASFDPYAKVSSTPGGNGVPSNTLPIGGPQKFFIGVLDTGAQSNIISS